MKSSTLKKLDTVPCNIIFFPSQPSRKNGVARKLTARNPQMAGLNILRLPQGPAQAPEEVRELFEETREILMRRSGVRAAMSVPCQEFSGALDSTRTYLSESHSSLIPGNKFEFVGQPATRKPMTHSNVQSQMAAFFELKRSEKPPENFMSDFILEFHKRNDETRPKSRRSATGKKARQD